MESTYFPVPFAKLPSNIQIEELKDFNLNVGSVCVRAQRANHPGHCVGYRLFSPEGLVAFFPDTEPRQGGEDREMIEFLRDVDVLILDSQYDSAEYKKHIGWGHGCVDDSVALAVQAGVKRLCLFHHDPDHDDKKIDSLVRHARRLVAGRRAKLKVDAARELQTIVLPFKSVFSPQLMAIAPPSKLMTRTFTSFNSRIRPRRPPAPDNVSTIRRYKRKPARCRKKIQPSSGTEILRCMK